MNRDPYRPSDAAMSAAPRTPKPRTPAPWAVSCGVSLYALSFVLFFVLSSRMEPVVHSVDLPAPVAAPAATPTTQNPHAPNAQMLFGVIIALGLFAGPPWLLFKVIRRRNWARITLTLGSIAVVALATPFFFQILAHRPADAGVLFGNEVLEAISLVLLFTPAANQWFGPANDE